MGKMKQTIYYALLCLSFGQYSHQVRECNHEKLRDIEEVVIQNTLGKVTVRSSENDETNDDGSESEFDVWQEGRRLVVRNRRPTSFWEHFQESKRIDFNVNVAPSVKNFKVDCKDVCLDIENCEFDNIRISGACVGLNLKNVIGNFFCESKDLKGLLDNVKGSVNVSTRIAKLCYLMRDFVSPIKLRFDGKVIKFRAFVADSFRSLGVSHNVKIKKSHLPILVGKQDCDLNIKGNFVTGSIRFAPLSEFDENILQTISAYDYSRW